MACRQPPVDPGSQAVRPTPSRGLRSSGALGSRIPGASRLFGLQDHNLQNIAFPLDMSLVGCLAPSSVENLTAGSMVLGPGFTGGLKWCETHERLNRV